MPNIASDTEEIEVKTERVFELEVTKEKSVPKLRIPARGESRTDKRKKFLAAKQLIDQEDEAERMRE